MKIKQLSVFFVISLFLLSAVPLSFAEEQNDLGVAVPTLYVMTGNGSNGSTINNSANTSDDVSDAVIDPRLRISERTGSRNGTYDDGRAAQVVEARQNFVSARERLENLKQRYLEKRSLIVRHKAKLDACGNSDSEDCEKARFVIKQNAGAYLSHSADMVLNALEKLRSKVESAEDIDDDSRVELISDITSLMEEVQQAKMIAEQLTEESTREEVNEAAKTIRLAWNKVKRSINVHTSKLMHAKLGNIVARSEMLLERLERTSDKLEEQGHDVSDLDSHLSDLDSQLESAKDHYESAVEAFKEAREADNVALSMKEFQRQFSLAKEELQKVQRTLRAVVKEIRSLNGGRLDIELVGSVDNPDSDPDDSDDEESEGNEEEGADSDGGMDDDNNETSDGSINETDSSTEA